jgi:flagellar motility protein MotE (MotC chaperone)
MDQDMKAGANDLRYNPGRDSASMQKKDTRKTRLSLKQINELRKASEQHILEQEKELEFVEQMYKTPATPPA